MSEQVKFQKLTRKELKEKYKTPFERIKHMSNGQIAIRVFAMFMFMATVTTGIYLVLFGMPIFGIPSDNKIVEAEISSPRLTEQTVVVTDDEYIEYARNIVSYLNKSLFYEIEGDVGEPIVTIKYTDQKGNVSEVAANETVLFYQGETYPLAQKKMFVAVAEGVFFPDYVDWDTMQEFMP